MQIAAETAKFQSLPSTTLSEFSVTGCQSQSSQYGVIHRNGVVASFYPSEIPVPVTRVFLSVGRVQGAASAVLQLQIIDGAIGKLLDRECQAGNAPSSNQLIGPIG